MPRDHRPRPWTHHAALVAALTVGLAIGLGGFTFVYARGGSYLTNDPEACANCHIMGEHFSAWVKSSHRSVATCNDCHTPHDPIGKYVTKARNGFWHSFYFTTGNYPDPLRITPRNREVAEGSCRHCHAPIVEMIDPASHAHDAARAGLDASAWSVPARDEHGGDDARRLSCVRCHRYVGHWVR